MKLKKRKIIALMLAVMMLMASSAFADVREPESRSYNGYMDDGTCIYDKGTSDSSDFGITPRVGYEYVEGYERVVFKEFDESFARIYGTSISFVEGTSPSYTLTVTKSVTKETSWNVSGSLSGEFNISVVKAKAQIAGGYESRCKATVTKGETWNCDFNRPGTYVITWYMRGFVCYVQCGATIISTGGDHGNFRYYNLGTATFPSDEVHMDVAESV